MQISSSFQVARPREQVWALFQDVPRVAACIPGTQITEVLDDGRFKGRVEVKLGPIAAAFEGDAEHTSDHARHTGNIVGNGRDRGGSRAKFTTVYTLTSTPAGTTVTVDSDVSLAGPVAQFGRSGLMQEVTGRIVQQFTANLETLFAAEATPGPVADSPASPAPRLNLGAILWASLVAWLRGAFGRLVGRTG